MTPMSARDPSARGRPADPEDGQFAGPLPDAEPGIEDPEADYIEQRINEGGEEYEEPPADEPVPLEAPEADVVEQRRIAPVRDDEDGTGGDEYE